LDSGVPKLIHCSEETRILVTAEVYGTVTHWLACTDVIARDTRQ